MHTHKGVIPAASTVLLHPPACSTTHRRRRRRRLVARLTWFRQGIKIAAPPSQIAASTGAPDLVQVSAQAAKSAQAYGTGGDLRRGGLQAGCLAAVQAPLHVVCELTP